MAKVGLSVQGTRGGAHRGPLVGNAWADVTDGKGLFCMPTQRNFQLIDVTAGKDGGT